MSPSLRIKTLNKQALEDLVLKHARFGMQEMTERHGSFHQQAMIMDMRGKLHLIVIADDVLHGPEMRQLLTVYALSVGGADAILIQADARMKKMMDAKASKEVEAAAAHGKYIIADDPTNPECFITAGRSREHQAVVLLPYSRTESPQGDVILFETPEPRLAEQEEQFHIGLIPNIWERVN
jgi:hypothetical protein